MLLCNGLPGRAADWALEATSRPFTARMSVQRLGQLERHDQLGCVSESSQLAKR